MCGFLFQINKENKISQNIFKKQINYLSWRGPDSQKITFLNSQRVGLMHCRLSIIDLNSRSDQPMKSLNGRYYILFNGEIYNHKQIRDELNLLCKTNSDTETIIEGFSKIGDKIFKLLEGMFALVIYDSKKNTWIAARDSFGIKPLYIHESEKMTIISSETSIIANLVKTDFCPDSIRELRVIRRPIPGKTLYKNIQEIPPGIIYSSLGKSSKIWEWEPSIEKYDHDYLQFLIKDSVKKHLMSDVKVVSLLSGGIDSAIITALSKIDKTYTIGLYNNNEFRVATQTAKKLKISLKKIKVLKENLYETWKYLINLRKEPLNVPNEGLIYLLFKSFNKHEKVALTGEGADEIFFGYDKIFRQATLNKDLQPNILIKNYFYDLQLGTERLDDYIADLARGKSNIDFLEDFFYQHHLPTLLRRMDFASMAASKEARVPFIDKKLIGYLYRLPSTIKINKLESKIPLREIILKLNLGHILLKPKIGFSSKIDIKDSKTNEYKKFYDFQFKILGWEL